MNYAMLSDVYSPNPSTPGLLEESRKRRAISNKKGLPKTTSPNATTAAAVSTPPSSKIPATAPKMNLHTQSNEVDNSERTVVVDDYNDEYDITDDSNDVVDNTSAGVFYGHEPINSFDTEDDILDIVLFIIAGLMFIILLDQVFQMGISVGQSTLKLI